MKRINLNKYGFIRWSEKDFSDDGNHFKAYRAGKAVRVSKLVADGQVYLSISSAVGNETLPYEIYSKLPHYEAANWKWNGVKVGSLTDQDLIDFYNACILYEQEYEEMEATFVFPTTAEILKRCSDIRELRVREVEEINTLLSSNLPRILNTASSYTLAEIQRFYKSLVAEVDRYEPNKIRKAESVKFCSQDCNQLNPSWWYRQLKELIEKT